MSSLKIHGAYLIRELLYHWGRSIFVVGGVGLAVSMVILLQVLSQGFQSLAQLPFENLDADLVVQQSTTESALPETMGLMIPYSAQPIAKNIWNSLRTIEGVTEVLGTVLLWNFTPGKFFSVSGIPLQSGIIIEAKGYFRYKEQYDTKKYLMVIKNFHSSCKNIAYKI